MNVMKLQKAYFGFYNQMKHRLIAYDRKRTALRHLENPNILTQEEKKAITAFWGRYKKIDLVHHAFLKEKTGKFYPEWIPQDVHFNYIDEYFNDRDASQVLDNKSLYFRLFPDIPQVSSLVSRMGKLWYDEDHKIITLEKAQQIVGAESALFVKAATQSYGGMGVQYIHGEDMVQQFMQTIKTMRGDIVVQRPIRQHAVYAKLNESSVNTLRLFSVLSEEGVKIYSAFVRMGVNDAKVDNVKVGGIACGVDKDQRLVDTAYRLTGEAFTSHPNSGLVFEGYQIVGYDKAKALVEKAHPMIPYFKMVAWDIVIDEQGEAVMLEANFAKGGIAIHQLFGGPMFGEDTKKILDEVFGKNK